MKNINEKLANTLKVTCLIVILIILFSCKRKNQVQPDNPLFTFGLIADPQYKDSEVDGSRYYNMSLDKMTEALNHYNQLNPVFVQTLGDVVDTLDASWKPVLNCYNDLKPSIRSYHLLGNHDYTSEEIVQADLLKMLNMPNNYYSYQVQNYKFIVLDGSEVAYYSYKANNIPRDTVDHYWNNAKDQRNQLWYNGAISNKQLKWLDSQLQTSKELNQNVIIFCHFLLGPEDAMHSIYNNKQVLDILDQYNNIKTVISGHYHKGAVYERKGIKHIALHGMVETMSNSYSLVKVYNDRIELEGFGNQENISI